jgi:hypothetical protein
MLEAATKGSDKDGKMGVETAESFESVGLLKGRIGTDGLEEEVAVLAGEEGAEDEVGLRGAGSTIYSTRSSMCSR